SGLALELLVWFLAGLTCCARPVFALTTLLRGCIFGLVLSLFADSAIAVGSIPMLAGYVLITLVLILFASGIRQWGIRYGIRFLVCAGAAMSIIVFIN
ncbi:MAG: hypothetical protein IJX14_05850, partial [Clostridia bacterium]|nr:hypothetical protein [Clostridia bacterium]